MKLAPDAATGRPVAATALFTLGVAAVVVGALLSGAHADASIGAMVLVLVGCGLALVAVLARHRIGAFGALIMVVVGLAWSGAGLTDTTERVLALITGVGLLVALETGDALVRAGRRVPSKGAPNVSVPVGRQFIARVLIILVLMVIVFAVPIILAPGIPGVGGASLEVRSAWLVAVSSVLAGVGLILWGALRRIGAPDPGA